MRHTPVRRKLLLPLLVIFGITVGILGVSAYDSQHAYAVNVIKDENRGFFAFSNQQNIEKTNFIQNIVNILLFVLGTAAVIAIIIAGITYATANGDASKTKQAKDTIMYAVIGLIVALMAWGIVSFVLQQF